MVRVVVGAALGLAALAMAGQSQAAVSVMGDGLAHLCSMAALSGVSDAKSIETCTLALENEPLSGRDKAGTLVNRGVMYLARLQYSTAKLDFDDAVTADPTLGEAYVNRGAALVAMRRYSDGVVDIEKGMGLAPEEPEKAYYNRALAREGIGDLKGAYLDYLKASQLKPDWADPQRELMRFAVHPAGSVGS